MKIKIHKLALAAGMAVMLSGCTNPNTPAGHEGYVFEDPRVFGTGGFKGTIEGPGNFGVSPWRNRVINVDIRPNTYSESFQILARDDLNVSFVVNVLISLEGGRVQEVVEQYGGEDWYARYVREPFRTYVREAVQTYESGAIKEHRSEIATDVRSHLAEHLGESPFTLVSLVVGNIEYPDVVTQAVEQKLAAQQLLAEKDVQREIARRDAEIRIEEAKGIAEAQRIINETLSANYLQHEAIQAQESMADSPNHTTVYIPVGANGIPIVYAAEE
jgi:regulator of protease activity HflC (stomatin/prohibitin superfamily)